jgi:hypothetical protein
VPVLVPLLAEGGFTAEDSTASRYPIWGTQAARNYRSLLNLQQNDSSVIGSHLVFHFGGGRSDVASRPLPDSCIAIR